MKKLFVLIVLVCAFYASTLFAADEAKFVRYITINGVEYVVLSQDDTEIIIPLEDYDIFPVSK